MKKILSFLSSISIISIAATSTISCGPTGRDNTTQIVKDKYVSLSEFFVETNVSASNTKSISTVSKAIDSKSAEPDLSFFDMCSSNVYSFDVEYYSNNHKISTIDYKPIDMIILNVVRDYQYSKFDLKSDDSIIFHISEQ
jgi:hypothetical protein